MTSRVPGLFLFFFSLLFFSHEKPDTCCVYKRREKRERGRGGGPSRAEPSREQGVTEKKSPKVKEAF